MEQRPVDREQHGEQTGGTGGLTPSSAPNTSFDTGAGDATTGFDSPAVGSISLSNPEVAGSAHADPYYPPDGPADRDSSVEPGPAEA